MSDKQIELRSSLPEIARQELIEANLGDLNAGDVYIRAGDYPKIIKVVSFTIKNNGKVKLIKYVEATTWDASEFDEKPSSDTIQDFQLKIEHYDYIKVVGPISDWFKKAEDIIAGTANIADYEDKASDNLNSDTSLMANGSKMALIAMQGELEAKKHTAELMAAFIHYEMERRMRHLDSIKQKMYGVVAEFRVKIEKVMRVITIIELYLGIDEELFCLQEGQKAHIDTPITFRQAVLYMDEETGHWENGGLDYSDIKWFDEWLLKDNNYKRLLPEEKGMLVFRPRRFAKDYGEGDAFDAAVKNAENKNNTYLLIRNGESLYRVFSSKIVILPRLFPLRKELQELFDDMLLAQKENKWKSEVERTKEKFEDSMYGYRKRAMLMQGLIDRSEVFHPLPCKINIFNLEETKHLVNFVYDDEATLPSGRLAFTDWQTNLNSSITHGSRILITGAYGQIFWGKYGKEERMERFPSFRNRTISYFKIPELPRMGIYDVEIYKEEMIGWLVEKDYDVYANKGNILETYETRNSGYTKTYYEPTNEQEKRFPRTKEYFPEHRCKYIYERLTFLYLPDGVAWTTYEDRKNKVRFEIHPEDKFILHWDRLSIEDIDFYLESRVDRPNYLDMMPVLLKTKALMIAEKEKEAPFIKLLVGTIMPMAPGMDMETVEARVIRSVEWWKWKNKIKRPIDKDDVLAIRMIQKRVTSKNYDKLKWE